MTREENPSLSLEVEQPGKVEDKEISVMQQNCPCRGQLVQLKPAEPVVRGTPPQEGGHQVCPLLGLCLDI